MDSWIEVVKIGEDRGLVCEEISVARSASKCAYMLKGGLVAAMMARG